EVLETHSQKAGQEAAREEGGPALAIRSPRTVRGVMPAVAGDVGANMRPRLLEINGYRINVEEPGYLLVSSHMDRPGIIGKVGTILGQHQINIAYMQVGRDRPGGHAVMVLGVDSGIPEPVLAMLREIPDLWDIRVVEW
ncbi:MAG: ACT domain-containing protein, partial [Bacillota bacterium]